MRVWWSDYSNYREVANMTAAYLVGVIVNLAIMVYVVYRGLSRTIDLYRRSSVWKATALMLLLAVVLIGLPYRAWWWIHMEERLSLEEYVASALIGVCLGGLAIWLERRYYPGQ